MALRSSKRSLEAGDGSGAKEDPRPSGCLTSEEPTSLPSTGSTVSELNLNGSGAPLLCRVIAKSENRSWFVERNTKKVFTFRMVDGTGEVSVVAFDGLAEKFHEMIQIGLCYRVSLYATKRPKYAQGSSGCEIYLIKVIEVFLAVLCSLSLSSVHLKQPLFAGVAGDRERWCEYSKS